VTDACNETPDCACTVSVWLYRKNLTDLKNIVVCANVTELTRLFGAISSFLYLPNPSSRLHNICKEDLQENHVHLDMHYSSAAQTYMQECLYTQLEYSVQTFDYSFVNSGVKMDFN